MSELQEEISALAAEVNDTNNNDNDSGSDNVATEPAIQIEDEATSEATDEAEAEINTIAELADAIGWTPEDAYAMKVSMGDNQEAVPLGELKDSYQGAVRDKAALETKVTELQGLVDNAQQGFNQQAQISQQMQEAQANAQAIKLQYTQYNWQEAEANDPGQAALTRQKFNDAYNNAIAQVNQVQAQQTQQASYQLQQAGTKLHQLIPEWNDSEAMKTGQAGIRDLLNTAGYDSNAINTINDPIAISLLNELVMLRKEKASGQEAVKLARKAPKVLKGGGFSRATKNDQSNALIKKARQTHDKRDEFNAVKALLSGG